MRQGDIVDSFYALRGEYERLVAGSGMLAAAEKLSLPGEKDEALFMWALYFLSALCHSSAHPLDLSLCFIVKLMAHAGYRPMLSCCALCNKPVSREELLLDSSAGGLVCLSCASHRAQRIHALSADALERMLLVAPENLANVSTTRTEEGGPYQRRVVVFQAREGNSFGNYLNYARRINDGAYSSLNGAGVRVTQTLTDETEGNLDYNPTHPDADENGYVRLPNVDVVREMVDMMGATRAYEANITALNATKSMLSQALEIGRA